MSINVHFTALDWARIERDWAAWWAGELERPLVMIENLEPLPGVPISNIHNLGEPITSFALDTPADEILDHYQVRLEAKHFHGDVWPRWYPNCGPGIVAGFLGAQVRATQDTVWFEPAQRVDTKDLHLAYDGDNAWWQRVKELTQQAVGRWGRAVSVAYTDLGGNLDILASLLTTEQLLMAMIDSPGEVARLVGEVTRLWLRYYDKLDTIIQDAERGTTPWAAIWAPRRCYMLQCDLAAMISPGMFERFVVPDLEACCQALDYSFYHLDGPGQIAHLDMLLALEKLDGIQWIPGAGQPPPEAWLPLLQRVIEAGKLCQLYVSPQGARTIVHELGGRGFAFYIEQQMPRPEAEDLIQTLVVEK
jgi:5-methyltetrahydrofolate--homocysteine methyltransferase